jgi:hypothetical protein
MAAVQQYDALNGHDTPGHHQWTEAFTEVTGKHANLPRFWTALNSPFKHSWYHTNVVGFPDMHDDLIFQTLQYHLVQQQLANRKGQAFRGVYVVPYRPHAAFWKFIPNFQVLSVLPKRSFVYGHPSAVSGRVSQQYSSECMYVIQGIHGLIWLMRFTMPWQLACPRCLKTHHLTCGWTLLNASMLQHHQLHCIARMLGR